MKNITAIVMGLIVGFVALVLLMEWCLQACLPVKADEKKWQCDVVIVGMIVVFLIPGSVSTIVSNSNKLFSGVVSASALVAAVYLHPMFSGLVGKI